MEDESFESSEESDGHSKEENSSLDSYNRSQSINNISIEKEINYWKNYLIDHFIISQRNVPNAITQI